MQQFQRYPHMAAQITSDILQVLYIGRDQRDNTRFSSWMIEWQRNKGWSGEEIPLPSTSGVLKVLGSGGPEFRKNMARYQEGPAHGTSRCTFHCFCDTLFNIQDQRCGGAPQLVGLYRKPDSSGIAYGVIKDKKRYFLGAFVGDSVSHDGVEWRNDLFERCDGTTMKRIVGAQKQPDALRRT